MLTALATFETRVQLRRSSFRIGLLLLALAPLAGILLDGARYAGAFFGYGYFGSLVLRLNLGMADDQQSGHDLLMSNFASARQRMGGKLTGLLVREALVLIVGVVIAALVWGNFRTGLWYALQFTFIACLLLPIATAIELTTRMRTPGALAILIAFVFMLVALQASDPMTVFARLGISRSAGSFAALDRLFVLALGGVILTLMICGGWALARRELRG